MFDSAVPMTRSPSFLMTVVSLVVSGWVVSLLVSLWLPLVYGGSGVGSSLGYTTLATALIGGLVLRAVLPRLVGVEIAYGWAVVALGSGNLLANLFTATVQRLTVRHLPTAAPVIGSNPLVSLGATGIGFLVSYWVIVLTAHGPRGYSRPAAVVATGPRRTGYGAADTSGRSRPTVGLSADLARTQAAVAQTCIEISRAPAQAIPGYIVDAMAELSTCANTLRNSDYPNPRVRAAVSQLVSGLDRFQQSLVEIAEDAAACGNRHIVQRGLLFPSMSDSSDGGSRARYELDHADGLATIRDAFQLLQTLGVLSGGS